MTDENDLSDDITDTAKSVQEVDKVLGNPLSLLLGPIFKVYGDYWGELAKRRITEKQKKNLRRLTENTEPSTKKPKPSVMQVSALIEWADHAKNIDPDIDYELGKAWSFALDQVFLERYHFSQSLRGINSGILSEFLSKSTLSKSSAKLLSNAGLIRKLTPKPLLTFTVKPTLVAPLSIIISSFMVLISAQLYSAVKTFLVFDVLDVFKIAVSAGLLFLSVSLLLKITFRNTDINSDENSGDFEYTDLGRELFVAVTKEQPPTSISVD